MALLPFASYWFKIEVKLEIVQKLDFEPKFF